MTKAPPIELEGTRVDLGEDLLQTRTIARPNIRQTDRSPVDSGPVEPGRASIPETPDELVVNAKILRGEGLIEEAKRTLHRALILDPGHLPSRQLLDSIHADEVKELLRGGETPRRGRHRQKSPLDTDESPDEILRKLEADLNLSCRGNEPFASEEDRQQFVLLLEKHAQGAPLSTRIDLGIAFLEMGLYRLARSQFEVAQRDIDTERKATLLLAQCFLLEGEPFQALLLLDPLVADASRGPEEKLEVGYLMARAYEDLQRWGEASLWYRGVTQIDEQYRDAFERFQRCERIRSSSSR